MIQGAAKIRLSDAAVLDALTRYLCDELKSPVVAEKFTQKEYDTNINEVSFAPSDAPIGPQPPEPPHA